MNEIVVYMKISDNSVVPGAFQFSTPYWDGFTLAHVSLHPFTDAEEWGVTVSGCDDGGLHYVGNNREEAFDVFLKVLNLGEIDVDSLLEIGLQDADSSVFVFKD
jgi:hypothetical protein